uniref:Peptidase aspartic putative domain-containing protein n=1 Tax=Panagrolaimus davidi TaxID=227884 RepID=A0A914PH99_9BILA
MSQSIRQQLGKFKKRAERIIDSYFALTPKWNALSIAALKGMSMDADKCLKQFDAKYEKWETIIAAIQNDDDRATEEELFDRWKEDDDYVLVIQDLQSIIRDAAELTSVPESTPIAPLIPAKIAAQNIQRFDGEYLSFKPFWQRFVLNIDSKPYDKIDKLDVLFGLLEGKALKEVEGTPIIKENYDAVKQALIDRFGNDDQILYALQTQLSCIKRADSNANSLRDTVTSIHRLCRQLKDLGVDVNNSTLKYDIIRKMPTREQAELLILNRSQPNISTEEILKKMKEFECRAEVIAEIEGKNYYSSTYSSSTGHRNPSKGPFCSFCNGNHASATCQKFKSIDERLNQLRSQQRCFKCAGRYHSSKECRANVTCQNCNGNHRSFLCDKSNSSNFNKPTNATKTNVFLAAERIQVLQQNQSPLLAKEITVKNPENNKEAKAVVPLDSGSQRNFVSNDLVRKLGLQPIAHEYINVQGFGGKKTHHQSTLVEIRIPTVDSKYHDITAYSIPSIAKDIPMAEIKNDDPLQYSIVKKTPDIVVGMEDFFFIVTAAKEQNGIFIIDSKIGKMISGKLTEEQNTVSCPAIVSPSAAGENLVELENTVPLDEWWNLHKMKYGSPKLLPGQFYLE